MQNNWTPQQIELEIDIFHVLSQLSEEAIVDYLESIGYNVEKREN